MKSPAATPNKFRLLALIGLLGIAAMGLLSTRWVPKSETTETIEPGLTLTTVERTEVYGPVRLYIVRAEPKSGWRFQVVTGGARTVDKADVSQMGAASGAPLAVNGSFFFYDGPAVGPLKQSGQWLGLPWSNRTSLGIAQDGSLKIDPLTAKATLTVGTTPLKVSSLNGDPSNRAVRNGFTLLTPRYGPSYKLNADESALEITNGKVTQLPRDGKADITANGFALIARGTAKAKLTPTMLGQTASFSITTNSPEWDTYPTILGGGPRLVRDGKVETTEVAEKFKPDVVQRGPRTALGIDASGNYILLVADGWGSKFQGLTLPETAAEMVKLGAVHAMNLDGGNSTALAIRGELKNFPVAGNEVPVANALILKKTP